MNKRRICSCQTMAETWPYTRPCQEVANHKFLIAGDMFVYVCSVHLTKLTRKVAS